MLEPPKHAVTLSRPTAHGVAPIALANRVARQIWAMFVKNEDNPDPAPAA